MENIGHYKIIDRLGQGAMGAVYRAFDEKLERPVALKVLRINVDEDERTEYSARLFQEAKSAARLNHPNIITVFDSGEIDGQTYIAMELVEGRTLKSMLVESSPLSLEKVIQIADQLFEALVAAHAQHVFHRDIKPANLMFTRSGRLKVMDFGVAQLPGSDLTRTGAAIGSPRYMAPEQIECRKVDGRADLFSAGVVLYESLLGKPPFDGDNMASIAYNILHTEPPTPVELNSTVPEWFSRFIMRCLRKKPEERHQHAESALFELRECISETGVIDRTPPPPTVMLTRSLLTADGQIAPPVAEQTPPVKPTPSAAKPEAKTPPPASSSNPALDMPDSPSGKVGVPPWAWIAGLVAVLGGAGGFFAWQQATPPKPPPVTWKPRPAAPTFELALTDARGPGARNAVGEHLSVLLKPSADGFAHCYYEDVRHTAARIFPNPFVPNAALKAGVTVTLPSGGFKLRFDTAGTERIGCIAATSPLVVPEALANAADLTALSLPFDQILDRFRAANPDAVVSVLDVVVK